MKSLIYGIIQRNLHKITSLSAYEKYTFKKILKCRTERVPDKFSCCDSCGTVLPVYKSCKNRMCPVCNGSATVKWIAKRESELLPTGYFMLTYTIPSELKSLFLSNKKTCYDLLFKAMSKTLLKAVENNNRSFHGKAGFFSVLHTWDQRLNFQAPGKGENKPQLMIRYLSRYVNKTAVSDKRIKKIENGNVHLSCIDRKKKKAKIEILTEELFMRRLVLHILPKGFKKIRFYGFLANRSRKSMLVLCRILMGIPLSGQEETEDLNDTAFLFWKYFKVDISLCSDCGKGHIFYLGSRSGGG